MRSWVPMRLPVPAAALGVVVGLPAAAQVTGYEALTHWEALSWSKAGTGSLLFSSYDRTGANLDYSYYLSPTGFQTGTVSDAVVASVDGPGVLSRFWMPHSTADRSFDLRVFVDGTLVIDTNSNLYLAGNYGYVDGTLTHTMAGGQTSYEPIVFQESLLILSENKGTGDSSSRKHYYQYNVQTLSPNAHVFATTGTLSPQQQAARNLAAGVMQNIGSNPGGTGPAASTLTTPTQSIAAGQSLTLAGLAGSGTVKAMHLGLQSATDAELDGLRLRVSYDGASSHAIDVAVSQFFGVGQGRQDYQSLPMGVSDDGSFYAYWPMPFREGAVIELYNATGSDIVLGGATVEAELGEVAPQAGYFHAVYHEQTTTPGQQNHELLDVQGAGHYVGNLLWVELEDDRRNILEGDDIITIDGTQVLYGTGLEDAYNGGYYYNHIGGLSNDGDSPFPESDDAPFAGLLRMDFDTQGDPQTRTDQYRWLIADPVAFEESINVTIENFGNQGGATFGSTAFYYLVDAFTGDLNGDGFVGIADLDIVLANWGTAVTLGDWRLGDASNDGWVGDDDLNAVLSNWGAGTPPGDTVPEPATALVLASGLLLQGRRRSRSRTGPA